MPYLPLRFCCALLALALLLPGSAHATAEVHKAVGAGPLYPDKPEMLLQALDRFYAGANPAPPPGRLFAIVAPHSGYGLSGAIAAQAFKSLTPGQFDKVIVLGPSHFRNIEGCSIPAVTFFETPFGLVTLQESIIRELCYSPMITMRGLRYEGGSSRKQLHEQEYSIEMVLPFLQERLSRFTLVPVLVGEMNDTNGMVDPTRVEAVADTIREVLDERTLLVISTDFTHYGHDFSFKPFVDNAVENIQALDDRAYGRILEKDFDGFLRFLEKTGDPICGADALLVLLKILPKNTIPILHASGISMAQTGDPNRSVSYASFSFYLPNQEGGDPQSNVVRSLTLTPEKQEFKVLDGSGTVEGDPLPPPNETPAPAPSNAGGPESNEP
ncbi:MAG: AmmeMemoRadiSam system protein B [Candidatus Hydrogenedentes bacterium]|nr:AmmeMemoRadiSam system protein B [Candidatus Hydrogenedentota bacterium]